MKYTKKAEPTKDDETQTRMTKATGSKPETSLASQFFIDADTYGQADGFDVKKFVN